MVSQSSSREKVLVLTRVFRGGEPVGLSPNIRVYRYSKGQYFDCHCESVLI